ncbi:endolytic transglycosylase MltG [Oceanobacillus massiliensis]|uniref:endolytic transglycosylase MltG n=1 Tax=Oceanobacillus massiliensis TaxID=1465765 RepID=UPI0002880460|nr:endolytic transglycosylase MltG [Oceanobacillus massiliensis]
MTISPGMASSDISSLLAENQIIQDASEFNSYLDEHDYSLQIQIGSYELTSDMSFYQIAERLAH